MICPRYTGLARSVQRVGRGRLRFFASTVLKRLPLTTALVYLAVGVAVGPYGLALIDLDLGSDARLLERIAEVALLISLFTTGLKLRARSTVVHRGSLTAVVHTRIENDEKRGVLECVTSHAKMGSGV